MKKKYSIDEIAPRLQNFLVDELKKTKHSKAVIGLSGGVDSAVSASLLVAAIGSDNVHAIIMPYKTSNPDSASHAKLLAQQLDITYEIREITAIVDSFFHNEPDASALRKGNRMARERMCILYDYSAKERALVVGTSNKTEILMGYGTIFGDLACAINPLGNLYKTQVWELAKYLNVPQVIINKAPSADLWEGQTDEDELGYAYEEMDALLALLIDEKLPKNELLKKGYSEKVLDDFENRIRANRFKGKPPVIANL
jgi:NAD+ synthase